MDSEVKKENKRFKNKCSIILILDDEELKKKGEHLSILKEQHDRIQDIYLNKIKKLDQELKDSTGKLKTTEDKARVEIGSLKSQIKM